MKQGVKQIPNGVSNFVTIREQNLYYVDKTMYLPMLEDEARNLFCIRPRRFGKSLLLSMLRAYYDVKMQDKFQSLFGDLWIGSHPTPWRGKYQILFLDFSKIGGDISSLRENFNQYCGICLDDFMDKYGDSYPEPMKKRFYAMESAVGKLNILGTKAESLGIHLYLVVDEYDNFTNVVLNEHGEKVYWALTHASGFYREIFKVFKGMFDRIFMTGVSPVTLDDLTSGFNIGWHISTKSKFNQMLGFSTEEVRKMFRYYQESGVICPDSDVEKIIAEMKPWYDNYCFSADALKTQSRVFNCDMVLYYLRSYAESGEPPKELTAPNTRTDYNKMNKLLQLDKLDGNRQGVLMDIIEKGEILGAVKESFPARDLTMSDTFVSLLFYYGMLTVKGVRGDRLVLGIPNNNVRKQYYDYLLEIYQDKAKLNVSQLAEYYYKMAFEGEWKCALQYMADAYANVSSVRDSIEGERNLQGFFMAYLNLNNYYYTAPELELNHGYCDFFLLPNLTHYASKHSYILELKMIPRKEKRMSKEEHEALVKKQWQDAEEQIRRYAQAPRVEALRQGTQLHKVIMQFDGWKLKRMGEVE